MANVDPNVVISAVITDLTKSFLKSVRDKSIGLISSKYDMVFEDFKEYLASTYNKCNNVKTIVSREKPYEIEDIYVNGMFKCGEDVCDDNALCQDARDNKRIVVTGFGGIGKTIFAKHLWLSVFKESAGKIPFFIELRKLNNLTSVDLETVIRNTLFPSKRVSREDLFDEFLINGRFIFIFDAFDELNEDKKGVVEDQILAMSYRYPDCGFVVTSRRESRFDSWEQFHIFKALPFEKEQVRELIQRIDFDAPIKKKFISEIVEKGFGKHESFLSTPLLSLMMLITFSQYGELPEKIHIFYRYAFQALYAWHDASKEAFRRERKSGLLIDQFEKVFAIFCMMSYYDFETIFSEKEILEYIEKAKRQVDFSFSSKDFVWEADQSVNLIFKEGNWYNFTHRSFQEYFTAFALSSYFPNKAVEILKMMTVRPSDSMLAMLYEINPVIAEENILNDFHSKYGTIFDTLCKIKEPIEFLAAIDFQIFAMVSWRRRLLRRRQVHIDDAGVVRPQISVHVAADVGARKAAEIVCAMFRNKFEAELGELYTRHEDNWNHKVEAYLLEMVKDRRPKNPNGLLRASYDFRKKKLEVFDENGVRVVARRATIENIFGDEDVLNDTSSAIKSQVVFARKLCEAVSRKVTQKRVSIDDLLI